MANIQEIAGFIWEVADEILRDDFKRSKYPDVILPFVVLRRLDCVLAPTKNNVLQKSKDLKAKGIEKVDGQLRRASGYAFYNTSRYDFQKLLDDPKNIDKNLIAYINGFSENVRDILDNFNLRNSINLLHQKELLFLLIQKFANTKCDLHPDQVSNHDMGYVFEELIRRFNEQSNENPGEHFTPREVIRLMVRLLINVDKAILSQQGVNRSICDPACGTGGMLSIAKDYVLERINPNARLRLFGQEVNPETYAICKSDMLIKGDDRDADNIVMASTLSKDGHIGATFDYQLSNPPYGKDWKKDSAAIEVETNSAGGGRFHAGLPRISDGQMLFLQHMISKMTPKAQGGGRVAIVMNGSPLFTGDAGGGESEIRRWILEEDLLETIVALPGQLFYNTGILTYIWVLSNRKSPKRKGKVLLVNGAATEKSEAGDEVEVFARKMRKSLGDKRNELSDDHIGRLAALALSFEEGDHCKIFDTADFGYRKITVERPLRLNFAITEERLAVLRETTAFANLATSKKKDAKTAEAEIEEGCKLQRQILDALATTAKEMTRLFDGGLAKNRDEFAALLKKHLEAAAVRVLTPLFKAIVLALSERDETADICIDANGDPELDPQIRDTENVLLREDINAFFEREVKPHVPDAWINEAFRDKKEGGIGIIGYEINFNRYFYRYEPPRPLHEIVPVAKPHFRALRMRVKWHELASAT